MVKAKNYFEAEADVQWNKLTGEEATGWNDAGDAFRHAYVAARFAQYLGSGTTEALGVSYEVVGKIRSRFHQEHEDPREIEMDEYNNRIGAEFGAKYNDLPPDDLAREIKKKTENGELITDPKTDPRAQEPGGFFDPFFGWVYDTTGGWTGGIPEWAKEWLGLEHRNGKYHVYDPITLDLNGDGIQALATNGFAGALFDHDNDCIRTATGWVNKNDGLLVCDLNGNGIIDNGNELFGDNTALADSSKAAHGFAALAQLDSNNNGKIDALDSAFNELKVWIDANSDGISQASELHTLMDLDIQSLNVAHQDVNQNLGNGNSIQLTQAANLRGIGRLRDLNQITSLANVLKAYS